jgi:glutamate synthase domain-containing protein 3
LNAETIDLAVVSVRELNAALQGLAGDTNRTSWRVLNARGQHALAVGMNAAVQVEIAGHAGYFCAGMNQRAEIVVEGNAGNGIAENMMSGMVRVRGDASAAAGATAHGGLLVIEGNAAARCGIGMKGVDIVVGGNAGPMSAFMAQAGTLTILGDAGDNLGDSLYEAQLFVRGRVASLGTDCVEKPMRAEHLDALGLRLEAAGFGDADPADFRRYGSARRLYHFHPDHAGDY